MEQTLLDDFAERYRNLRSFIIDMSLPRMREIFRVRAKACNFVDHPDCKDIDDFLLAYRTSAYDNKMRGMVNTLCNLMWGKECFGMIEKMVMDKLKLKYKNKLVGSDDPVKTNRRHGNIKKMINRLRQTLFCDRFRYVPRS